MHLIPVRTPILKSGDNLAAVISSALLSLTKNRRADAVVRSGDIVVFSSKAVATVENAFIALEALTPSLEAKELSRNTGQPPQFCEAVLQECRRLNGRIVGTCIGGGLTDVRPEGMTVGSILVANAGLDQSNAGTGFAIGWPKDPVASAARLRKELETRVRGRTAVIITDSCCRPRRLGVTAIALTVSGLDPLQPNTGPDLFGRPLRMTTEAVADQLATAANFLMGNASQSTPAVIIREHGLTLSDWEGWVPGIEPEVDLFRPLL